MSAMNRAVISAVALSVIACTGVAAQQERLAGDWRGYWVRAGDSMLVTMRVQRDAASGNYQATFDAERLRVSGIPFARTQVQGCCDVMQEVQGDRTTLVFTGRLS